MLVKTKFENVSPHIDNLVGKYVAISMNLERPHRLPEREARSRQGHLSFDRAFAKPEIRETADIRMMMLGGEARPGIVACHCCEARLRGQYTR